MTGLATFSILARHPYLGIQPDGHHQLTVFPGFYGAYKLDKVAALFHKLHRIERSSARQLENSSNAHRCDFYEVTAVRLSVENLAEVCPANGLYEGTLVKSLVKFLRGTPSINSVSRADWICSAPLIIMRSIPFT